jgi:hypothetical protein
MCHLATTLELVQVYQVCLNQERFLQYIVDGLNLANDLFMLQTLLDAIWLLCEND